MPLPALAAVAVRYVGSKLVECGIEKAVDTVMSAAHAKDGSSPLDKIGKLDVPLMPSAKLVSAVAEPAMKALLSHGKFAMK